MDIPTCDRCGPTVRATRTGHPSSQVAGLNFCSHCAGNLPVWGVALTVPLDTSTDPTPTPLPGRQVAVQHPEDTPNTEQDRLVNEAATLALTGILVLSYGDSDSDDGQAIGSYLDSPTLIDFVTLHDSLSQNDSKGA